MPSGFGLIYAQAMDIFSWRLPPKLPVPQRSCAPYAEFVMRDGRSPSNWWSLGLMEIKRQQADLLPDTVFLKW